LLQATAVISTVERDEGGLMSVLAFVCFGVPLIIVALFLFIKFVGPTTVSAGQALEAGRMRTRGRAEDFEQLVKERSERSGRKYAQFLRDGDEAQLMREVAEIAEVSVPEFQKDMCGYFGFEPRIGDIIEDWERCDEIDVYAVEQEALREALRDVLANSDETKFWEVMTRISVRMRGRNHARVNSERVRRWAEEEFGLKGAEDIALAYWSVDLSDVRKEVYAEQLTRNLSDALSNEDWWFLWNVADLRGENMDEYPFEEEESTKAALTEWAQQEFGTSDSSEIARMYSVDVDAVKKEVLDLKLYGG
jgi:hypothetical protein